MREREREREREKLEELLTCRRPIFKTRNTQQSSPKLFFKFANLVLGQRTRRSIDNIQARTHAPARLSIRCFFRVPLCKFLRYVPLCSLVRDVRLLVNAYSAAAGTLARR